MSRFIFDDIETIRANSYRNFHAKGLDYVCAKRSPEHTIKYYFLDGDATSISEVVNPHDHRYHFTTTVLLGSIFNAFYEESEEDGEVFNAFEWRTPLLGGNGFDWSRETRLREVSQTRYGRYDRYDCIAQSLHTIRIAENRTVLRLDQFEDVVGADSPTMMFSKGAAAPDLSGLYDQFSMDDLVKRLQVISSLEGRAQRETAEEVTF